MPIHDLGYRAWEERDGHPAWRWLVIAETGVRLAWKSHWLRRMLLVAWLPAVYLGFSLYLYERSFSETQARQMAPVLLRQLPHAAPVLQAMREDRHGARPAVWALLLLTLFRYPQGVLMVMLVGLIGPALIARDMRSRAFLLYFSRPLERADYVLGKSAVVWVYLTLITTCPAMALYVLGVALSPDLSVLADTWDLPLRILAASLWLILPTTALSLCFSSLTTESRYAAFAWFGVWIVGWVTYLNLTFMEGYQSRMEINSAVELDVLANRWTLVSLYHCLGVVQSWIFGLETDAARVWPPLILLMGITLVSLMVLFRRVSAPLKI